MVKILLLQLNRTLSQDVHDRALFYYRLLQYDPAVAERVVNPPKQAVSVFADTQSSEMKDRIFDEFNSLSVVYQKVCDIENFKYGHCLLVSLADSQYHIITN